MRSFHKESVHRVFNDARNGHEQVEDGGLRKPPRVSDLAGDEVRGQALRGVLNHGPSLTLNVFGHKRAPCHLRVEKLLRSAQQASHILHFASLLVGCTLREEETIQPPYDSCAWSVNGAANLREHLLRDLGKAALLLFTRYSVDGEEFRKAEHLVPCLRAKLFEHIRNLNTP